jgi:iron-sulfur cluster assembly accessory protein
MEDSVRKDLKLFNRKYGKNSELKRIFLQKAIKNKSDAKLVAAEDWGLSLTDSAAQRINHLVEREEGAIALRLSVSGGGCSGFQYEIDLDEAKDDDLVLKGSGENVVSDSISLPFLTEAVIDFSEELIGARFVINNPNATASCGCGTSFSM